MKNIKTWPPLFSVQKVNMFALGNTKNINLPHFDVGQYFPIISLANSFYKLSNSL